MISAAPEDCLAGHQISELCSLTVDGQGQPEGILVTNREIDDPRSQASRLTPERMRIAEHLLQPSPAREMLIAHKTISEWLQQDERRTKPPARIAAKKLLETLLSRAGLHAGTPGRYGGWLTLSLIHI